jgi:2-polyprenyl-6-methoxyphenol hydroxylase-like FAD-dependent oxidoreductase
MSKLKEKSVLISGASFAGLSTAFWMKKLGYKVTIVEIAKGIKKGGTPVNVMGKTIDALKGMGLLDQVRSNRLVMTSMEFKNTEDITRRLDIIHQDGMRVGEEEYEVERDLLLNMLYDLVKDDVEFMFDDSIVSMKEADHAVAVGFKQEKQRSFSLIFGCDGIHSVVRKHWFGEESEYAHFLQTYFSITTVDKLLIPEYTTQIYNEPGKMAMLNAYNNKTDVVLCFYAEDKINYDYRNEAQMRDIVAKAFTGTGWRTAELLNELMNAKTFYFDQLCQMKMPSWTKGRVALVGDSGYCPSPAAGRGGSLAIDGAAALADAFEKCNGDFELAFLEYNKSFRPFVEELQDYVVKYGLDMLIPKTEEAITKRNIEGWH